MRVLKNIAFILVALGLWACQSKSGSKDALTKEEPSSSTAPKTLAPTGISPLALVAKHQELAVFADADGLVTVDAQGGKQSVLYKGTVGECLLDNKGQVVWFAVPGEGSTALYALDLTDGSTFRVASALDLQEELLVEYNGDAATQLKMSPNAFYDIATKVDLKSGAVGPQVGCDGDSFVYCFDESIVPEGELPQDLNEWAQFLAPENKARFDALANLTSDFPERLQAIGKRGHSREFTLRADLDELDIAMDKLPNCEEVDEELPCNRAQAIAPGSIYYTVTTDESRGDFYHQEGQLYDSQAAAFLKPTKPGEKSDSAWLDEDNVLHESGDILVGQYSVSKNGTAWVHETQMVTIGRGVTFTGGKACGWIGGGYPFYFQP